MAAEHDDLVGLVRPRNLADHVVAPEVLVVELRPDLDFHLGRLLELLDDPVDAVVVLGRQDDLRQGARTLRVAGLADAAGQDRAVLAQGVPARGDQHAHALGPEKVLEIVQKAADIVRIGRDRGPDGRLGQGRQAGRIVAPGVGGELCRDGNFRLVKHDPPREPAFVFGEVGLGLDVDIKRGSDDPALRARPPLDRDGDERRVMGLEEVGRDIARGPADAEILVGLEGDVRQAPLFHLRRRPGVGPADLGRPGGAGADDVGEIGGQLGHPAVLQAFEPDPVHHAQVGSVLGGE